MTNPQTILVVEDDALLGTALSEKLTRAGFDVTVATDGSEGLHKALELHPRLILLDILMPKTDGIAFLKELRTDAWGKEAQVILLTNVAATETVAEAMELGSFEYFIKADNTLESILARVHELTKDSA